MPTLPAAVVFDFDGILLDSETPEFESHRLILARYGVFLTVDDWVHQIGIYTEGYERHWYHRIPEDHRTAYSYDDFVADKHRLFRELVSHQPMRGIAALLDVLADAGVPLAVASSSPARWVAPALKRIGIAHRFGAVVTGDLVERRKPAPDVYLRAAERLGVNPGRSVAIEDSAPGIAAARAAGMKVVCIPHWLTESHDLSGADVRRVHAGEVDLPLLAALWSA